MSSKRKNQPPHGSEDTQNESNRNQFNTTATTVEGAAFLVPDELKSDISDYRTGLVLPDNEIIVANADELYVVFTDAEPQKGAATVDGTELNSTIDYQNITFDLIDATSTTIKQNGTERSIADILSTPSNYAFDLVRLTDHHQSVAIRTRDDVGEFSFANTTGVISGADLSPSTLFDQAADKIRSSVHDPADAKLESRLSEPGETIDPFLYSASFDTAFWEATPAIIDGIVLTPNTKAKDFIGTFGEKQSEKVIFEGANKPLIWIVQTGYNTTTINDVSSVGNQPDGELVSLQAKVFQKTVSVQEVLEETTSCTDAVQINGNCVPVINDVILHGGAAWTTTTPQSDDDLVPIFGLSSLEQLELQKNRTGEYEIIGEVVTTDRIDENLPDGTAVLVYEMNHLSNINYDGLATEVKNLIEDLAESFYTVLKSQAKVSGDSFDPVTIDAVGGEIQVGGSAKFSITAQEIEKIAIKNLWTDWQIVDQTLSGGSGNNKVKQEGVYEVSWSNPQDDVSPSITIEPPGNTYSGGDYLIDLVAHDGGDETTAILSLTSSSA